MPDLTKHAACSPEMVCAGTDAILLCMLIAFSRGGAIRNARNRPQISNRSSSCPVRCSLLKEGGDALLRVRSDCIRCHYLLCVAIGVDLVKINLHIVCLLSQSYDRTTRLGYAASKFE